MFCFLLDGNVTLKLTSRRNRISRILRKLVSSFHVFSPFLKMTSSVGA